MSKIEGIILGVPTQKIYKVLIKVEKEELVYGDKFIIQQEELLMVPQVYDSFIDVVHLTQGEIIYKLLFSLDEVGWIKEFIDAPGSLIQHRIIPLDPELILQIIEDKGEKVIYGSYYAHILPVYIDMNERRKLVDQWVNPMDSYTKEDPMYYYEPVLMRDKAIIWVPGVTF